MPGASTVNRSGKYARGQPLGVARHLHGGDDLVPCLVEDAHREHVRVALDREQALGVADAERRADLAPGRQHGSAPEELHERQPARRRRGGARAAAGVVVPARTQEDGTGQRAAAREELPSRHRREVGGHRVEPILRPMTASSQPPGLSLVVDGQRVEVADDGSSLLDVLRDRLGNRSPKDGCSPQGQCGCCTVLVDGQPRVVCVTPARRVRGPDHHHGRRPPGVRSRPLGERRSAPPVRASAASARPASCAGSRVSAPSSRPPTTRRWSRPSSLTCAAAPGGARSSTPGISLRGDDPIPARDLDAATARATLETGGPQLVAPDVALGHGGFSDDSAPPDALVALPDGAGGWAVGATLAEARAPAGKVQGRRTTVEARPPLEVPPGAWSGDAPHQLGGARLPRTRCVVVRTRWRAPHAAGQRRRLRRQAPLGRR